MPTEKNQTTFIRLADFHNLESMRAQYTSHVFPRHFHETFVIEVVVNGEDEFYCNGRTHSARTGDIIFINPFEVHTGSPAGQSALIYRSLYPSIDLMTALAAELDGNQDQVPCFLSPVVRAPQLATGFIRIHQQLCRFSDQLEITSKLTWLLSQMISLFSVRTKGLPSYRKESAAVSKARAFIQANYEGNFTLETLSRHAGLSPFHLLRSFKAAYGFPPHEFLINMRVQKARQLLAQGHSIARAACEAGFYDQSHLTRHFKKIVGVTPGQFN